MLASNEIYNRVTRVLAETLNVDEDDLTPTATLLQCSDCVGSP